ncbi:unnamed protein product [Ectocarpus sp. 12 AP-2014]
MGRAAALGGNAWVKEIMKFKAGPRPFPIVVLSSWFLVDQGEPPSRGKSASGIISG